MFRIYGVADVSGEPDFGNYVLLEWYAVLAKADRTSVEFWAISIREGTGPYTWTLYALQENDITPSLNPEDWAQAMKDAGNVVRLYHLTNLRLGSDSTEIPLT
jgi:hypothetical protein